MCEERNGCIFILCIIIIKGYLYKVHKKVYMGFITVTYQIGLFLIPIYKFVHISIILQISYVHIINLHNDIILCLYKNIINNISFL